MLLEQIKPISPGLTELSVLIDEINSNNDIIANKIFEDTNIEDNRPSFIDKSVEYEILGGDKTSSFSARNFILGVTSSEDNAPNNSVYTTGDGNYWIKDIDGNSILLGESTEGSGAWLPLGGTAQNSYRLNGFNSSYFAVSGHTHDGVYEPVFSKNDAFNKNFGTVSGTVAEGDHTHDGVYEPVFSKNTGFNLDLGTSAGTVSEGDHIHDSRYYTETEIDALLLDKSGTTHLHTGVYEPIISKNTGFNLNLGTSAGTVSEGDHTHTIYKTEEEIEDIIGTKVVGSRWISVNYDDPSGETQISLNEAIDGGSASTTVWVGDGINGGSASTIFAVDQIIDGGRS